MFSGELGVFGVAGQGPEDSYLEQLLTVIPPGQEWTGDSSLEKDEEGAAHEEFHYAVRRSDFNLVVGVSAGHTPPAEVDTADGHPFTLALTNRDLGPERNVIVHLA